MVQPQKVTKVHEIFLADVPWDSLDPQSAGTCKEGRKAERLCWLVGEMHQYPNSKELVKRTKKSSQQ